MDRPVSLVPLLCLKCSTPIPAQSDEVAWACATCGQGQALDEETGLVPLDIHYQAGIPANSQGKPFWVCDCQVNLERETYSGNEARQAQQFWDRQRTFFIPAYATSLEEGLERANQLLLQPSALQDSPAVKFEPVVVSPAEVKSLAEFLVISVEAGRGDKLKALRTSLELSPPALWILP